jgi:hypothetical protein
LLRQPPARGSEDGRPACCAAFCLSSSRTCQKLCRANTTLIAVIKSGAEFATVRESFPLSHISSGIYRNTRVHRDIGSFVGIQRLDWLAFPVRNGGRFLSKILRYSEHGYQIPSANSRLGQCASELLVSIPYRCLRRSPSKTRSFQIPPLRNERLQEVSAQKAKHGRKMTPVGRTGTCIPTS